MGVCSDNHKLGHYLGKKTWREVLGEEKKAKNEANRLTVNKWVS